jgi:hypothetical protein
VTIRSTLALGLSALGLLAGCGGGGSETMRATLTDDGCTYDGPASAHAGRFTIEVSNDSDSFGAFFLSAVADDDADELQSTIDGVLRRFEKSGESPARVPWRTIVGSQASPSETTVIPADVKAGSYAVLCFVSARTDSRQTSNEQVPPAAVYVATRLDVTGAPTYP